MYVTGTLAGVRVSTVEHAEDVYPTNKLSKHTHLSFTAGSDCSCSSKVFAHKNLAIVRGH